MDVKLSKILETNLDIPIDQVYYWSDRMYVERYISNERTRFKTFVTNRLTQIREESNVAQKNYMSSKDNPADNASRGLGIHDSVQINHWFRGPEDLWQDLDEWPKHPENGKVPLCDNDNPEVKRILTASYVNDDQVSDHILSHCST